MPSYGRRDLAATWSHRVTDIHAVSKGRSTDAGAGASSGGAATPASVKKWESGRTMGKTYGGPGYKWESGRTMGKTYGGPGHKWFTGLQRGHANPAQES